MTGTVVCFAPECWFAFVRNDGLVCSGMVVWFTPEYAFKVLRPFSIHILSTDGRLAIKTVKPFRFYFHEMDVFDAGGKFLGRIKREFSVLTKKFTVEDAQGAAAYDICAPVLHPWTFKISKNGAELGEIVKNWSGLGKESFTDADNFSVKFPQEADAGLKAVLLGALFLIDMVYFEK